MCVCVCVCVCVRVCVCVCVCVVVYKKIRHSVQGHVRNNIASACTSVSQHEFMYYV